MTNKLQPCPFCLSKPEIVKRYISDKTYWYWVQYQKCKAETADAYNINDAVMAWNKRD